MQLLDLMLQLILMMEVHCVLFSYLTFKSSKFSVISSGCGGGRGRHSVLCRCWLGGRKGIYLAYKSTATAVLLSQHDGSKLSPISQSIAVNGYFKDHRERNS